MRSNTRPIRAVTDRRLPIAQVSFTMPRDDFERLCKVAEANGLSNSAWVRKAVLETLNGE